MTMEANEKVEQLKFRSADVLIYLVIRVLFVFRVKKCGVYMLTCNLVRCLSLGVVVVEDAEVLWPLLPSNNSNTI